MNSSSSLFASLVLILALAGIALSGRDMKEPEVINYTHPISKPCSMKFSAVDYSPVTNVCKAPDYNEKQCCDAFKALACKYGQHVNDYSTICPIEFVSYLNLAGSYPMGVFVGRCNEDGDHRLCSWVRKRPNIRIAAPFQNLMAHIYIYIYIYISIWSLFEFMYFFQC